MQKISFKLRLLLRKTHKRSFSLERWIIWFQTEIMKISIHISMIVLVSFIYFKLLLQEGKALKLLATAARLDIEDFLQKKVFLEVNRFPKFHFDCIDFSGNWRQDEGLTLHLTADWTGWSEGKRELETRRRASQILWLWGTNSYFLTQGFRHNFCCKIGQKIQDCFVVEN